MKATKNQFVFLALMIFMLISLMLIQFLYPNFIIETILQVCLGIEAIIIQLVFIGIVENSALKNTKTGRILETSVGIMFLLCLLFSYLLY